MTSAVVLGGGFAGVLAAMVLAKHVDDVVLIEGGRYPAGPGIRSGLPQAHHSHVLVTGGVAALEELLPGTVEALLARGAHRRGLPDGALILSADGWMRRHDTGAYLISCTRWLMDEVVRGRALAGNAVAVRESTRVLGLAGDASRVTGAVVTRPDGRIETVRADLVVDATGRWSRARRWLTDLGAPPVPETVVDSGMAYSTRLYRAPADLAATIPAVMVHPRPAEGRPGYGATLFPIEDGRWIVTLTGARGSEPPTDDVGFMDCARTLGSPIVADLMAEAEPIGGVRPYRATANVRRWFERVPRPAGFLAIGDALTSVNPVYSHGMSVAALGALRLADALNRRDAGPLAPADTQAELATVAERSWNMATEQDRRIAAGPAPRSGGRSTMGRAVLDNRALMTAMFRAQTLCPDGVIDAPTVRQTAANRAAHGAAPLTTDEAIAQYPQLSAWWRSTRRRAVHIGAGRAT